MADGGPPAPQSSPANPAPPVVLPALPCNKKYLLPNPSVQPGAPPVQPDPMPQLNWSHVKPEFTGNPDEDAEAHLLRIND